MSDALSFESGTGDTFGDILSRQAPPGRRPRVGLLGCGYFEYWRMFSDEFKQSVLGDLDRVAIRLRQDFDVVYPGVVDTLDAAEAVGRTLAEEKIEALIVVEGTYLPDFISLRAMEHVPGAPVILFTTQVEENVSSTDDYETLMRNSSMIGTAQLSGSLKKMGREYDVVVGSLGEDTPFQQIRDIVATRGIVRRLRLLNVGVVGHVFRGMYDLENDKTKIKGALGPDVTYVDISHLLRQWEQVSEAEAQAAATAWASRFAMRGTNERELGKSCRVGLAMERLVEHLRLDALCFLGQHYIEKETGAPARIGASMMLEKGRHMVACEGDLAGLIVMQIMHWMTGDSPLQAEWGQYDAARNALLLVGHGVASPALATGDGGIVLTGAPEEWGFEGRGANMEFILKPGVVTLAHLLDSHDGWQMLVSGGTALEHPRLPCQEIHALVQMEKPVKDYLADIQRWGVTHHIIVVHGDVRQRLRKLADMLHIRCLAI